MKNEEKSIAEQIGEQLVSVQPMPNDCFKNLYEASKTEDELRKDGYKPVSGLGLIWVKNE